MRRVLPESAVCPLSQQALDAATDTEELRSLINEIDNEIIRLWRLRSDVSARVGALRVASGGTRIVLNRETQVIDKYRSQLGGIGAELALLVLRAGRGPLLRAGADDGPAREE